LKHPEYSTLDQLLVAVRDCRVCEGQLPLGPRPVLRAAATARILIVGQAPGLRVHTTGIPWDDPSGERLRAWMGVGKETFYDESRIAIIPMGYCYPGRGNGGDLPPRRECAQLWLDHLLARLPLIELTLLIGQHAQRHFLGRRLKPTLAETIKAWREYSPTYCPLPHPSPRNTPWLQRHSGFESELLPELRERIEGILDH
jgi:uracil-DNA glycosylase